MSAERSAERALAENAAELAGDYFDRGFSCTRSVLQAITRSTDQGLMAITAGFSCGIGRSGCLCGAVTGGVMALGLKGSADHSGALIVEFRRAFRTTCCRALSKNYTWMSEAHQGNCRRITVAAAAMVEALLQEEAESLSADRTRT